MDRGAQYASKECRSKLRVYGMKAGMSRLGICYDNACIEAFHIIVILVFTLIYTLTKYSLYLL
ncbi:hypothetical protein HW560_06360 [Paenibacillus sp. E222]|nr:hypothetical protein HW560_06360 [Paenibacillus sp. E222]